MSEPRVTYGQADAPHRAASLKWRFTEAAEDVPATGDAPPLVVWTPGLGANCDDYRFLFEAWARAGIATLSITHPGTDESVWEGKARPWPAMQAAIADQQHWIDRPRDVRAALDALRADPCSGRVNWQRIGIAGHSYGAFTTQVLAGVKFAVDLDRAVAAELDFERVDAHASLDANDLAGQRAAAVPADAPDAAHAALLDLSDPRFRAYVAMSSQGPGSFGLRPDSWDAVRLPGLHLTGTRDLGPLYKTIDGRLQSFARVDHAPQWLAILRGANHFAFGDMDGPVTGGHQRDPRHHAWIVALTTLFWRTQLQDDRAALEQLSTDAVRALAGDDIELRLKSP